MVEKKIAEAGSPEEFQKDQIRPNPLILVSVGSLFSRGPSSRVPSLKRKEIKNEKQHWGEVKHALQTHTCQEI